MKEERTVMFYEVPGEHKRIGSGSPTKEVPRDQRKKPLTKDL